MRHICLYTWGPDFHCVRTGPPEVVQEALADLKNKKKCGRRRGAGWINVVCQYVLEQNFEDRPVAENIFEEQEAQIKTHFLCHKVQHIFFLS